MLATQRNAILRAIHGGEPVKAKTPQETFVARIWLERGPDDAVTWRGHIRHVQGKAETYFQDLEDMCAFLEQVSGTTGPAFQCPACGGQAKPDQGR